MFTRPKVGMLVSIRLLILMSASSLMRINAMEQAMWEISKPKVVDLLLMGSVQDAIECLWY
jgi:hypothetical protein